MMTDVKFSGRVSESGHKSVELLTVSLASGTGSQTFHSKLNGGCFPPVVHLAQMGPLINHGSRVCKG